MSDMVRFILILVCILLLSALFILYMRTRVDVRNNPFHRFWNLILSAYLQLSIGVAYGMEYLETGKKKREREEFSGYTVPGRRMQEVHRKEIRLAALQEEKRVLGSTRKNGRNLKILK